MSLFHRAPREVYRVYGEDEYVAEPVVEGEEDERFERPAYVEPPPHSLGTGRLLGIVVLVLVALSAVGVVALNASRRTPAATSAKSPAAPVSRPAQVDSAVGPRPRQERVAVSGGTPRAHARTRTTLLARPVHAPASRVSVVSAPPVSAQRASAPPVSSLPPVALARLPAAEPSGVAERAAAEFGFER
jgi:hypothetical protein